MSAPPKKLKCPACGSPCGTILATTVEDCENPGCRFFGGAPVLELMQQAEELLRSAELVP